MELNVSGIRYFDEVSRRVRKLFLEQMLRFTFHSDTDADLPISMNIFLTLCVSFNRLKLYIRTGIIHNSVPSPINHTVFITKHIVNSVQ